MALRPGQVLHLPDDRVERIRCGGGEPLGALALRHLGKSFLRRHHRRQSAVALERAFLHGGERATALAARNRPGDAVDQCVQLLPIVGELLLRTHHATGGDDGHQVAGLHLAIHEVVHGGFDLRNVFSRGACSVGKHHQHAPHLACTQLPADCW